MKLMCELHINTSIFSSKMGYVQPKPDYIFWPINMSVSFKMVFMLYCIPYLLQHMTTFLCIATFQENTYTEYV
jgi:hypothetical protein